MWGNLRERRDFPVECVEITQRAAEAASASRKPTVNFKARISTLSAAPLLLASFQYFLSK